MGRTYKEILAKVSGSELAESAINKAVEIGATYAHFQPGGKEVEVRYRTDGELIPGDKIPSKLYGALLLRLKALANLQTDNRSLPQRGKFKVNVDDNSYTISVNTMPTVDGEKLTIELTASVSKQPTLKELGLWGYSLRAVEQSICEKNGLILLTGPPKSGKSTTLFSMIDSLSQKGLNIISVEDPIKYQVKGISQIEINPSLDMGLSKVLEMLSKQDLDVIALSQIPDRETMSKVVALSAGNHLVLSRYFSMDSARTITQIMQLDIESALIAHSLRMITGQRLVRKLCLNCRKSFEPDKLSISQINNLFDTSHPNNMKYIHQLEINYVSEYLNKPVLKASSKLGSSENRIKKLWRPKPGGCKECNHSGYKGRTGIYEVLMISSEIEKLIVGQAGSDVVRTQAIKQGMVPLEIDGLVKTLQGVTSIEEITNII